MGRTLPLRTMYYSEREPQRRADETVVQSLDLTR